MRILTLILSEICLCVGLALTVNSLIYSNTAGFVAAVVYTVICYVIKKYIKYDILRAKKAQKHSVDKIRYK